jgi:molecular chaperone DnaJ
VPHVHITDLGSDRLRPLRVSLARRAWKNERVESPRDFYDVLGVARGADAATIKRAFRTRARLLHPDVSVDPDAESKFRELAEAYAVLSRSPSRLLYDHFGYRGRGVWAAEPASAHAFARLMEFWARATRRAQTAGAVGYIELGFYEAMRGGRRLVRYTSRTESAEPCSACSGRGTVRCTDHSGDVVLLQLVTCKACAGSGMVGGDEQREALVSVPAGAEDGDRIPIRADPGAFVVLRVSPQPPDSMLVRAVAGAGLLAALGFLAFLFLG